MDADAVDNLKTSLAALILGGLVAAGLTGVVDMQTVLYFRLYSTDRWTTKLKVAIVFLLDFVHTCMIATALYLYFVSNFGDTNVTDQAFWAIGISIGLTAVLTVNVHFFFAHRLFTLSQGNYWVTVPVVLLAIARVGAALVTTVQLIRIGSFSGFGAEFHYVFTLGLVLSSAVDFMITGALCFYLRRNRTGTGKFDHILDSVTLYTIENGLLTSVTTLVSLIFWLARPHVLIYLGLHFAISKLYANSFLASMNARKILRAQSSNPGSGNRLPMIFTGSSRQRGYQNNEHVNFGTAVQITVDVDKTVEYGIEDDLLGAPSSGKMQERDHIAGV
ncbi:hypothetical protein C8Q76DRAFT_17083 [Earliella scabrosa]|nr:hypothetical protein C8Q76DRAFT_17083 [Earliella scabrosa]